MRRKEHCFLYLKQSCEKKNSSRNNVDIIDPTTGFVDSIDVYEFSKQQKRLYEDDDDSGDGRVMDVIDPEQIKQIIMVCLDESLLMEQSIHKDQKDTPNCQLASIQYLTSFANR